MTFVLPNNDGCFDRKKKSREKYIRLKENIPGDFMSLLPLFIRLKMRPQCSFFVLLALLLQTATAKNLYRRPCLCPRAECPPTTCAGEELRRITSALRMRHGAMRFSGRFSDCCPPCPSGCCGDPCSSDWDCASKKSGLCGRCLWTVASGQGWSRTCGGVLPWRPSMDTEA